MIRLSSGETGINGLAPVVRLGGVLLPLAGRARVYACGITPYDVTHLGHAATFVWTDALCRVLHACGAEVLMSRNVTDVDDVLLAAARKAGAHYDELAAIQQFYFDRDMAALGVSRPAAEPRAHAYIGQMIALAAGLMAQGAAYERDGGVFFRGRDVARRAVADEAAALRLAAEYGDRPDDPRKDDPFDVAVWQPSGRASSPGRAHGALAVRAGMPSAPRWRCTRSARRSMSRPAVVTCGSRITRFRRPWRRRSLACGRSPGPG